MHLLVWGSKFLNRTLMTLTIIILTFSRKLKQILRTLQNSNAERYQETIDFLSFESITIHSVLYPCFTYCGSKFHLLTQNCLLAFRKIRYTSLQKSFRMFWRSASVLAGNICVFVLYSV